MLKEWSNLQFCAVLLRRGKQELFSLFLFKFIFVLTCPINSQFQLKRTFDLLVYCLRVGREWRKFRKMIRIRENIALRPHTSKNIKGGWSHHADTREPVHNEDTFASLQVYS
jgi:hypothetical protein